MNFFIYWFLFSWACMGIAYNPSNNADSVLKDPPVLIELFTSQGCSSCPPADRLLKKFVEEAKDGDLPIVALSYHVDYWNRLGWKDPYSNAEFSQRQRNYATKFPDNRVYTPEIVVNGSSAHVGSREMEIRKAIGAAKKRTKNITFLIEINNQKSDKLNLYFKSTVDLADYLLQIVLVEAEVGNVVPKGENRGRSLHHVQVVRDFITLVSPASEEIIEIPTGALDHPSKGKVVVFLQEKTSWTVVGVQELDLFEF
jgi:hypothetical protein